MLWQHFVTSPVIKKEILATFEGVVCRNLDAAAAALFLLKIRDRQTEDSLSLVITIRQVASVVGLPIKSIGMALKRITDSVKIERGTGSISNIPSLVRSVLPQFELLDPFTGIDCSKRVRGLTEQIVQIIQKQSTHNIEPNFIIVAACFVAWKSCFLYQKEYHQHIPFQSLKTPKKVESLQNFLSLINVGANDSFRQAVGKSAHLILSELGERLKKMPWIKLDKQNYSNSVPQYLEQILMCQSFSSDMLAKEAEMKRQEAPPDPPAPVPKGIYCNFNLKLITNDCFDFVLLTFTF